MYATTTTTGIYGNMYNCTYVTTSGNSLNPYTAYDVEQARKEGQKACEMKIKAVHEEMDNLLEDYLEELRCSEEDVVDVSAVIEKLSRMQRTIESLEAEPKPQASEDDMLIG